MNRMLIRCPRCQQWKAPTEYGRNVARTGDRADYCRPCHRLNGAETRARIRAANLARRQALAAD